MEAATAACTVDNNASENAVMRSLEEELQQKRIELAKLEMRGMDTYMDEFASNTQFFTEAHPNCLEYGIMQYCKDNNLRYEDELRAKRNHKKYEMTFDIITGV